MNEKEATKPMGLNIYTCRKCRGHIVTRHVDDGVTPFTLGCRVTDGCSGWMYSSMYRVYDQTMRASHEWYKPADEEYRKLSVSIRQHVDKGGVLLRPSTEESA